MKIKMLRTKIAHVTLFRSEQYENQKIGQKVDRHVNCHFYNDFT